MRFRILEHKADLLIESKGKSFPECFENMCQGMLSYIARIHDLKEIEKKTLETQAGTLDELVNFSLSDILYLGDAERIFFKKAKVAAFSKEGEKYSFSLDLFGETRSPSKGRQDIKAVTFHELRVEEKNGHWTIRVLFDV